MRITIPTGARIVLTVLVVLLVGTGSAFADSCLSSTDCTYQLDFANDTSSGGLGVLPTYGSVELTLVTSGVNSGQINFLVTLASGFKIFDPFGFNSSIATDPSSLNLTSSTSGFTTGSVNLVSPKGTQLDGFGGFEYVNNGPNGPGNGSTSLSFSVALPNSGTFTDVHQLVEGSSKVGSLFAAHVFNGSGTCDTSIYSCTGWIGTTASAVPEPSSYLWLMGAGFGLIILVFERRRRRTA